MSRGTRGKNSPRQQNPASQEAGRSIAASMLLLVAGITLIVYTEGILKYLGALLALGSVAYAVVRELLADGP